MDEHKANLFMVGAMKAGTTSFTELLSAHADVYASPIKEPHYFVEKMPTNLYRPSRFFSEETYFVNDFPAPLHIADIQKEHHYESLFSLANEETYRLDASTAYLQAPEVALRIKDYNSAAKIIIVTRNPLERAFSHYKMDLGLGRTSRSFQDLIQEEVDAYYNDRLAWNTYLGMSFYTKAIARYKNHFEAVLVVDFDTFIKNKSETLAQLAAFLEIEDFSELDVVHKNKTKALRFQKLFFVLQKLGVKDYFSKLFGPAFRQRLFRLVSKDVKQSMVLNAETRAAVLQIFSKESVS